MIFNMRMHFTFGYRRTGGAIIIDYHYGSSNCHVYKKRNYSAFDKIDI